MSRYSEHINERVTPQTSKARPDQVENAAGGFVFAVDKWTRLDRFLILGAEGGTYYVDEKKLTIENAAAVRQCIAEDGVRTVDRIVSISEAGRAPKNDPAIFALALCAAAKDAKTRQAAMAAIPRVCRIGTHLFHFAQDVTALRGWSRGLRSAVGRWYTNRSLPSLALQVIKYQQRDKWSHRDLLRLAHPKGPHNAVYRWVTAGANMEKPTKKGPGYKLEDLPRIIQAFEAIHAPGMTVKEAVKLIVDHGLPHECVPNELKNDPKIWDALLIDMGITAIIRNLGKMTAVGLMNPMSAATILVTQRLGSLEVLKNGRVHPMSILLALTTYAAGQGVKGKLVWQPAREIVDALDEAFYLSFATIEPTGQNHLLALDVSGSMGSTIGDTHLSCRVASAAMAMVTARTEKNWHCVAFTAGAHGHGGAWGGGPSSLTPLTISPKQRLDDVVRTTSHLSMGGTDCALPMLYAAGSDLEIDTFIVYTDNETWAGKIHPYQALKAYRDKMGRPAKLIVVGMTSSGFSIADPNDAGMLDVVGFDASAPAVMADFTRGLDEPNGRG